MKNKPAPFEIARISQDDLDKLSKFYGTYFKDKPKLLDMDLWKWQFQDNTFENDETAFFVLKNQDDILGAIGGIQSKVIIDGHEYKACHPVNFFVHPDYKGLPALRLFRKLLKEFPLHYAAYVSDDAAKLFSAAGFKDHNESLKQYYLPLKKKAPAVSLKAKTIALGKQATRYFLRLRYLLRSQLSSNYTIKDSSEVNNMDLPNLESNTKIRLAKGINYLNWRFEKSPIINQHFFSIQNRSKSTSCLIVIHENRKKNEAILVDIINDDKTNLLPKILLSYVIDYYSKEDFETISTIALHVNLQNVFQALGFSMETSTIRFMYYSKLKDIKSKLDTPSNWEFLLGDTDVY